MLDPELLAKLDEISAKAEKAYQAAEKVRKYLFWTGVITIALIVLPLIGLVFAIPTFINNYVNPLNAATGNTQSTMSTLNSLGL
ncbi:MAG: hypothetical protein B7X03_02955 [Parcubacteria group bacterium 21-58-10]|nr:MAG: hypothetical protein B7X03_02955 [Parcubacteria group bacterium 21-58-10]